MKLTLTIGTLVLLACPASALAQDGTPATAAKIVPGSSLGLLRDSETKNVSSSFAALPPEVRAYARRPELLVITKATTRSRDSCSPARALERP